MKIPISLLIILTFAPLVTYIYNFGFGFSDKIETWGVFGDFIGGVLNPILSFSTLIAVLYSLKIQRDEFTEVQRKESFQIYENKKHNFETTFFNFINHLNNLINSFQQNIEYSSSLEIDMVNTQPGRVTFYQNIADSLSEFEKDSEQNIYSLIQNAILKIYFKYIWNILKYIADTKLIEENEKHFYCEIFKSQLSSDEIKFITKALSKIDKKLYDKLLVFDFFTDTFSSGPD
ncbi:putative phage abortive infection protein [Leptospira bandrabouensis]|uniref:Phage abortive infection protein n=1 Tax=Leptospira bandrabouensis TaxID=2484903 RepID=A0A6H3NJU5_9LEPT|nr:putative phage abortive infection protein [Leptospira bandrabouensis]MCG6153120.1 putative phage abortive infection protein [Leptospira bandrabouensis]TGN06283.1 hypothetical protein EHR07_17375 [Leptospira bandrabouensis]TGN11778.1 hypothetical protein EHR08_16945 [Leptospira bandrabouensis]